MRLFVCDIPPSPQHNEALHYVQYSVTWVQTPYPFQLCNDYFDILTSWKGLCGYDRDHMFCQDFCTVCLLITFPSHYSKQHVIPAVQHLHVVFSCFLIFCDDFTNWEYCCESAIILCGPQTTPISFNSSLPVHELWCIYQNNICFLKIVVNGFQVAGKAQHYFSF